MDQKRIYVFGGGTFSHVRNHMAIAAPAFGGTARRLAEMMQHEVPSLAAGYEPPRLVLTKMANHYSDIITNKDVEREVDIMLADKRARICFFNVALCDYDGQVGNIESGPLATRLKTAAGETVMTMTPAQKVLKRIRAERKDIFLVAFKTTTGATEDEQYLAGLNLLKANSCNLVLANDTVNKRNMIIVPEEARYAVSTNRLLVLKELCGMTLTRSALTFTRSTVIPGDSVAWGSPAVPDNLRKVVNHCIQKGAYKPFRGNTAGHFAVKLDDHTFLTSKRKTNYNNLNDIGLVRVESTGPDSVIAHGAKPSVGGQSQRIVFAEHPEYDCIVHFHCPPKPRFNGSTRTQQWLECGSHECGKNTSDGLMQEDEGIKAVYLDNHGPNIVFRKDVPAERVIAWIDENFDLSAKTGGLVA